MREPNEILFQISNPTYLKCISYSECEMRKLDRSELDIFNRHLQLCYPEKTPSEVCMSLDIWNRCYDDGTECFCLFLHGEPVARCAIERYSDDKCEAADVRVAPAYRRNGYAKQVVCYVTKCILACGKTATCGTMPSNTAMLNVIRYLGYTEVTK
jgi:RimJ/RimL family protein N-acetyltransferase